ncbi:tryparedoxin (TXN1) [Leptomonas pyrrhocoris]|uniref:Tryparedoxin (TXN1) n=1 Tax=Leptomonas pyrrhocoris TaxID=157538 RepID=A0A0M9G1K2_LEPPY|nr:tryparedoxin (TXN1) [Leptomonas pyrrhocoris]KPA80475.1 tryparedoxin (TXN1) [Leptomonas pyrrhocoris]|eukprot:XP_015658914.1 tryparedoxin (TXN1) [Leptomonas pyrrhocoris]
MSGLDKYLPNIQKLRRGDSEVDVKSLSGKLVFFYFSASWCPPCRGFTPQLIEFYDKFHEKKNFEVIFCTWDEEEDGYSGYYAKMPWLAVPFAQSSVVQELTKHFSVESIPTLIGVDADTGKVVTTSARAMVVKDPEGEKFPWEEGQ